MFFIVKMVVWTH